jgi:hypothetical protein
MGPHAAATGVVDHGGTEDEDNWRFSASPSTHRHPGPPDEITPMAGCPRGGGKAMLATAFLVRGAT